MNTGAVCIYRGHPTGHRPARRRSEHHRRRGAIVGSERSDAGSIPGAVDCGSISERYCRHDETSASYVIGSDGEGGTDCHGQVEKYRPHLEISRRLEVTGRFLRRRFSKPTPQSARVGNSSPHPATGGHESSCPRVELVDQAGGFEERIRVVGRAPRMRNDGHQRRNQPSARGPTPRR